MKSPSYVGVTGFTTREQVEETLNFMPQLPLGRKLMVGLLTIDRLMTAGEAKGPMGRNVSLMEMGNIWVDDPRCFNIIHYCSRSNGDKLLKEIGELLWVVQTDICHGIQLNTPHISPETLDKIRDRLYGKNIILQLGGRASDDGTALDIERIGKEFGHLANYLLLDFSAGRGREFDVNTMLAYIPILAQWAKVVVGGGLDQTNLAQKLDPLLKVYQDLSWDAEGKLRDGDDNLDLGSVVGYNHQSALVLEKVKT